MAIDDIFPRIEIRNGMAIPQVHLPSEGYEERVQGFYKAKGKDEVEQYADDISKLLKVELELVWDERLGLRNIKVRPSAGFDLDEDMMRYSQHNIYSLEQAIPVFLVATKFVSLL